MDRRQQLVRSLRSIDVDGTTFVSVLSGKGGVGKSVLAFNLAERLADHGYRVLVVDADFSTGNIAVLANIAADYGIQEIISGQLSLAEAVRPFSPNMDVLVSAHTGPVEGFDTPSDAADLAAGLRKQTGAYDVVIMDHSSGISRQATVLASASDVNLLVMVPELTSVADCYGLCKYLYYKNSSIDCRMVVNRTESEDESKYVRTKFSAVADRFLGRIPAFLGFVPEDEVFRRSVATQRPIATIDTQSPALQALNTFANTLGAEFLPEVSPTTNSQTINITTAAADIKE